MSSLYNPNTDKKRRRHSDDELKSLEGNSQESSLYPPPPEKKKKQAKSSSERVVSHDPMILSQGEQKSDVSEESSKKSSREFWTKEELKKLLSKFKVKIDKPSPGEFERELPARSRKAIAHKIDFINKKIRESLNSGDILN